MNTVIAVVVGAVIAAFTWPRKAILRDESGKITPIDGWVTAAQALAYGLIIAIGIAWIVQSIWLPFTSPPVDCQVQDDGTFTKDCLAIAGRVTYTSLGIGFAAAIILCVCMRKIIKKIVVDYQQRLG